MAIIQIPNMPEVQQAQGLPLMDVGAAGAQARAIAGAFAEVAQAEGIRRQERKLARQNIFRNKYKNDQSVLQVNLRQASSAYASDPDKMTEEHVRLINDFKAQYEGKGIEFGGDFDATFSSDLDADVEIASTLASLEYDRAIDTQQKVALEDNIRAAQIEIIRAEDMDDPLILEARKAELEAEFAEYERAYGKAAADRMRIDAQQAGLHNRFNTIINNPASSVEDIQSLVGPSLLDTPGIMPQTVWDLRYRAQAEVAQRRKAGFTAIRSLNNAIKAYRRDPLNNPAPDEAFIDAAMSGGIPEESINVMQQVISSLGDDFAERAFLTKIEQETDSTYINLKEELDVKKVTGNLLITDSEYKKRVKEILDSNLTAENKSELMSDYMSIVSAAAEEGNFALTAWFRGYVADKLTDEQRDVYVDTWKTVQGFVRANKLRISGEAARKFFLTLDDRVSALASGAKVPEQFSIELLQIIADDTVRQEAMKRLGITQEVQPVGQKETVGDVELEHLGSGIWVTLDGKKYQERSGVLYEIKEQPKERKISPLDLTPGWTEPGMWGM